MADHRIGCDGCGRALPSSARWCGRCGSPRPSGPPAVASQPRRHGTPRRWVSPAVTSLVGTALVTVLFVLASAGRDQPADPVGTPVDLVGPSAAAPERTQPGTPAVCTLAGDHAPCGDELVDDLTTVTSIASFGPDAVLVARRGGEVRRIDLPTVRQRWSALPFPGADDLELHTDDGPILVLRPGSIARLDPSSGRVRWEQRFGDPTAAPFARTLAVDGGILVLEVDGTLTSLHAGTGEVRWQHRTSGVGSVPTGDGLVILRTDGSELWHPDHGQVWDLDATLTPRPGPRGVRADGPLPLLSDQALFVVTTGERLEPALGGPTLRRVAGPVTLHLRWTDRRAALLVTAYGPGGERRWARSGLEVPCCHATIVPADGGRVAIANADAPAVLLGLADGEPLATLRPPLTSTGASLIGVAGDLALWHTSDGTIGTSLDGAELRFSVGEGAGVVSLEPLLLADTSRVVVLEEVLTRVDDPPDAGLRTGGGSSRS